MLSRKQINRTISAIIRKYTNANNNHPIVIIDGNQEPILRGDSWCYRTRGGRLIKYPSSYSKKGWSNMVYHNSTKHVEVGYEYLISQYRNTKYRKDKLLIKALEYKLVAFS